MSQVAFTPEGVAQKQTELYALPNSDLLAQANLMRTDFRQWIADNFSLNSNQQVFFDNTDEGWIRFISGQAAIAIENRLTINLNTEEFEPGASKLIRTTDTFKTSVNGDFAIEGTLDITVAYE